MFVFLSLLIDLFVCFYETSDIACGEYKKHGKRETEKERKEEGCDYYLQEQNLFCSDFSMPRNFPEPLHPTILIYRIVVS